MVYTLVHAIQEDIDQTAAKIQSLGAASQHTDPWAPM